MPALPSVPSVIRVIWTLADTDDQNMINRLFFKYAGSAPTDAELLTLISTMATSWGTHLASFYTANQSLANGSIEDLTSATGAVADAALAVPGTRAGTANPNGVAVMLEHAVARRYRGGHPKSFLTALVEADRADVAHWVSATIVSLQSAWAAWIADWNTNVWAGGTSLTPVNVSYYSGFTNFTYPSGRTRPRPNLRGTPLVDQIISTQGALKIASQRRRYK